MTVANMYNDQSEPPQQANTSRKSWTTVQQGSYERYNWTEGELAQFVAAGTFRKEEKALEHVALHPYWLSDPMSGVKEELESSLGKWKPKLNGYVVAVRNVRIVKHKASHVSRIGFMYQDQPWIHLDATATFYLYTPTVGQKLTGTVKKLGLKAVICVLFKCFSASVLLGDKVTNMSVDDELPFEIIEVQNRRKGPAITGKAILSTSSRKSRKHKTFDQTLEDWTISEEGTEQRSEDNTIFESASQRLEEDWTTVEDTEPPVVKSKKRKHKNKDRDRESAPLGIEVDPCPTSVDSSPTRKKKHKIKHEVPDPEPEPVVVVDSVCDIDNYTKSKSSRKKKHKTDKTVDIESSLVPLPEIVGSDDNLTYRKKKKKKHA